MEQLKICCGVQSFCMGARVQVFGVLNHYGVPDPSVWGPGPLARLHIFFNMDNVFFSEVRFGPEIHRWQGPSRAPARPGPGYICTLCTPLPPLLLCVCLSVARFARQRVDVFEKFFLLCVGIPYG